MDTLESAPRGDFGRHSPEKISDRPTVFPSTGRLDPRRVSRILRGLWFVLTVLLPSLCAAVYYLLIASDQYTAQFRCIVQTAEPSRSSEEGGGGSSQGAASLLALNSNVVVQYIKSPQIIADLDRQLNWRELYTSAKIDPLSRLREDAPEEDRLTYWQNHVEPFFDQTTGTISVSVRAFTPEDTEILSQQIIRLTDSMVGDMSQRSRADAIRTADDDVRRAAERVAATRQAIFDFRARDSRLDPEKESDADLASIAKLHDSLLQAEAQLTTYRELAPDSPSIAVLNAQLRVLQGQISASRKKLTIPDTNAGPETDDRSLRDFETLESRLDLDEKYYASTLNSLEAARSSAERQSAYLVVFVQPERPQSPSYPRRGEAILLVFLGGLGIWIFSLIMYHSIRDHI